MQTFTCGLLRHPRFQAGLLAPPDISYSSNLTKKMKHLQVECSQQPLNFSFHSTRPTLLAAGLVDGTIEMHDFACLTTKKSNNDGDEHFDDSDDGDDEDDTIVSSTEAFANGSCRTIQFSQSNSELLVVGGSGGEVAGWDTERLGQFSASADTDPSAARLWNIQSFAPKRTKKDDPPKPPSLTSGIQVVHEYSPHCWVSGNEDGCLRLWDVRQLDASTSYQPSHAATIFTKHHDDYISSIVTTSDQSTVLATSADGSLSVYDVRNSTAPVWTRTSDNQEDELLSLAIIKSGQKVVYGSGTGVLGVFSSGTWGDVSDRYPGHGASIDSMLAVNESTLLLGTGHGQLKLVTVQPDRCIGVLDTVNHGGMAIESIQFTGDRQYVGTLTHDTYIRLLAANLLDGDDDDEQKHTNEGVTQQHSPQTTRREARDSDDEWADADEDDESKEDSSGSDDDDDSEEEDPRRQKRLKTASERFFDDL